MLINKEKFCGIIEHIALVHEQGVKINETLFNPKYAAVENDFVSGYSFHNPRLEEDLVDLLELICGDIEEHWISYYIYELECGKEWCYGAITDKNGEDIPLRNTSELYDFLISHNEPLYVDNK